MAAELPVIRACYGLTLELSRRVEKFPRQHRVTLGSELTACGRTILGRLIRAKYAPSGAKAELLADANVNVELLRFNLRLAADLKALPYCGQGHLLQLAQDVGLQIGGWLKSVRGQ